MSVISFSRRFFSIFKVFVDKYNNDKYHIIV